MLCPKIELKPSFLKRSSSLWHVSGLQFSNLDLRKKNPMLMGSNCCYSINKVEALLLGGWSYFVKEGHNGVKSFLQDSYFFSKNMHFNEVFKIKRIKKIAWIRSHYLHLLQFFAHIKFNAQQCFVFMPQANFPAHNLNFH